MVQVAGVAAETLKHTRTPSSVSSAKSWADMTCDEQCPEAEVGRCAAASPSTQRRYRGPPAALEPTSVGSYLHDAGRCKPCAFFHTKGCNSGFDCEFCHLCPPHEKQRRKRLRRQMCNSLQLLNSDKATSRAPQKAGHVRNPSTASASTCAGHSRQWSGSTQGSSCTDSSHVYHHGQQQQHTMQYQGSLPSVMPMVAIRAATPLATPDVSQSSGSGAAAAAEQPPRCWAVSMYGEGSGCWMAESHQPSAGGFMSVTDGNFVAQSPSSSNSVSPTSASAPINYKPEGGVYIIVPMTPPPYPSMGTYAMQPQATPWSSEGPPGSWIVP